MLAHILVSLFMGKKYIVFNPSCNQILAVKEKKSRINDVYFFHLMLNIKGNILKFVYIMPYKRKWEMLYLAQSNYGLDTSISGDQLLLILF